MPSSYPAEMFRPGSGARAMVGTLSVSPEELIFTVPEAREPVVVLPVKGLGCRLSGYDNRTFFFTHATAEGAEVAVKDSLVAQNEALNELSVFQEARRVGRTTYRRFWGCVTLLVLGVLSALATVGTLVALLLHWIMT